MSIILVSKETMLKILVYLPDNQIFVVYATKLNL